MSKLQLRARVRVRLGTIVVAVAVAVAAFLRISCADALVHSSSSFDMNKFKDTSETVSGGRSTIRVSTSLGSTGTSTGSSTSSSDFNEVIRVGIAGAGAVAFASAALVSQSGHDPMLWSPSGAGTSDLMPKPSSAGTPESILATGAIAWTFAPRISKTAKQLVQENDVLLIALPANGHKSVFDEIAPFIRNDQQVIISSHASLGALYLAQLLRERLGDDCNVPITAWGTTVCTARRPSGKEVRVNTVRKSVDLCTIPQDRSQGSLELCKKLFYQVDTFRPRDGLLAISLSNLNPQNHLGIALGNISRMEKGETWYQSLNITPTIGRLLEALDKERLDIADALDLEVKTIFEHFHLSFHVPISPSISDMNQEINAAGNDVYGPNTADSRYITEDVAFGLVPTIVLGKLVNRPASLHESGVHMVSTMYGRDFVAENDLLEALDLGQFTLEELQDAASSGVLHSSTKV
jgi:opine dehydrogenase